ncbi:MAG: histidine kinase dimerization/phospho-acceptor domain-containing protein [Stellaceae bacterium]
MAQAVEAGAGAAIIAEEAFLAPGREPLFEWVEKQPPWSDFPFIILTTHHFDVRRRQNTLRLIEHLRNVTLQERPIQTVTLVSAVQAALRGRLRQYEAARYLAEREHAASRLEELVGERTRQLQEANTHLTAAQESLTMALEAAQMRTWHIDLARDRHEKLHTGIRPAPPCRCWPAGAAPSRSGFCLKKSRHLRRLLTKHAGPASFTSKQECCGGDEEVRWIVAEGRMYRDEEHNPVRLAGTIRDVTERRQVEESLRQTQKLEVIGPLTGGVAHDFNNLLTAVLGNIELASLRTRDQNLLSVLRSAASAAERGAKLTSQLLAFARKQHLAPRVVSLNKLVSSMGDLLLQTIGVTIRIETILEMSSGPC